MSTTAFTQASGQNLMKWEVAGANKKTKKQSDQNDRSPSYKHFKLLNNQMPRIEPMQPISVQPTIYDALRSRESSDEDADKKAAGNKKSSKKSPKPQKQQQQQAAPSAPKKADSDLELVLSQLSVDNLEQEYRNFSILYPGLSTMAFRHITSYLNLKLSNVPEQDPTFSIDDLNYPYVKLNKKLKEFFNKLIDSLNRSDYENVFEFIIEEIVDESKTSSYHGYKIVAQLLTRKYPSLGLKNLSKFSKFINAKSHRQSRCLIGLGVLGQAGFLSLSYGLKIWFEAMMPLLNLKSFTNDIVSYLYNLLQHSQKNGAKESINQELIDIKQYFELFDLINDKSLVLSKDTNTKLSQSFAMVKTIFMSQSKANFSFHFETILSRLPLNESDKQKEILSCAKAALIDGRDTYSKWREIYSKYIQQSLVLVKYVTIHWNDFKAHNYNDLKQTIVYFEQNSALYLNSSSKKIQQQANSSKTKQPKSLPNQAYIHEFNRLTKDLFQKRVQTKGSIMKSILKMMFYTILFTSLFFYWDMKSNGSVYTNEARNQLEKYGLLDTTVIVFENVNDARIRVKKMLYVNVPPVYNKVRKSIVYYSTYGWKYTKDYSFMAWKYTEPYINQLLSYTRDVELYVRKNLPSLVSNLTNVANLATHYLTTWLNFLIAYLNQFVNLCETQVFGMKKGELYIVLDNGSKYVFNLLSQFFVWINETSA